MKIIVYLISILFFLNFFYCAHADESRLKGLNIARNHCARCHVIGDYNKFGGIGSTPSFQLIVGMKDGISRFENFFERRPHPAFVRVPGVPRWSKLPPYATEFVMTAENLEDLLVFVKTIKKKDFSKIPIIGKYRNKVQKPFLK